MVEKKSETMCGGGVKRDSFVCCRVLDAVRPPLVFRWIFGVENI